MKAIPINHREFETMINGDKPVLVDFWAPWCTYCVRISEAYDLVAQERKESLSVVKVNIDEEPLLAQQEQIEVIPTLVLYHRGRVLGSIVAPESKAMIDAFIDDALGAQNRREEDSVYDLAVIGGGPGGYTAALYAARSGMKTVVLEKLSAGGQMALTHQIDNYPGFEEGVDGHTLGQKMRAQAERFGAQTKIAQVLSADLKGKIKGIMTDGGKVFARAVVIATGADPRELGAEREKELTGRGVHYCAACDGMFYKGKTVVVVGGGDTAVVDAMMLSRIAQKVILVHRRDTLRAAKVYHGPLERADNIELRMESEITSLLAEEGLTGVRVRNVRTGQEEEIACDGVFVCVGRRPASKLFEGQLEMDANGYIVAGETGETSLAGVYAVGDVRTKALRQVVTAVADGASAVHAAQEYLAAQA